MDHASVFVQFVTSQLYHVSSLQVMIKKNLKQPKNLKKNTKTQWAGKWPLTIFATKQLKQDFYFIV